MISRGKAAAIIIAVAIVGAFAWYRLRPAVRYAPEIAACFQLYATARSSSDTLRIDGLYPPQLSTNQPGRPTCGTLRAAFPKYFRRDSV